MNDIPMKDKTNDLYNIINRFRTVKVAAALILLMLIALPFVGNLYHIHVGVIILLIVMCTLAYNIYFGYMGQYHFGPIAFYGIGAYTAGLFIMKSGINWLPATFILAPLVAAIVALLISFPILRLRGHALALGTFAFAIMMFLIIERWTNFTGGGNGMPVDAPVIFGVNLRQGVGIYFIVLICTVLFFIFCFWLMSSKHGRAIKAIRGDEVGAAAMGINVLGYKRMMFVITGAMIGLAGGLLSQQTGWLNPDQAYISGNIAIILAVVVGGRRSNVGSLVGGITVGMLRMLLSDLLEIAILVYGVVLLVVIRFLPDGIVGVVRKWLRLPIPP